MMLGWWKRQGLQVFFEKPRFSEDGSGVEDSTHISSFVGLPP